MVLSIYRDFSIYRVVRDLILEVQVLMMNVERMLRMIAGVLILISSLLVYFVNINWIFLIMFIGLNLFQSAFTNWCPMMSILRSLGFKK